MNKSLLTALALTLAAGGIGAHAIEVEEGQVEFGKRTFYGFFSRNNSYTNISGDVWGFTKQTFEAPYNNEMILQMNGQTAVYAAAAIDGVYYAMPYIFSSSMEQPTPLPMMEFNIHTGEWNYLGEWSEGLDEFFKPNDMTYDIKNDRLLAIGGAMQDYGLYEVDRTDGHLTRLSNVAAGGGVIACDAYGRLFSIGMDGWLYQWVYSNTSQTYRANQLVRVDGYTSMYSKQSMEFDHTTHKLYWAANCYNNPFNDKATSTRMIEITLPDKAPGANYTKNDKGYKVKYVGEVGYSGTFTGLYIPYTNGSFTAPGFATETAFTCSDDAKDVTLTFKAPTTTFAGETLDAISGYDIYRDGQRIDMVKTAIAPGAAGTYVDKDVTSGKHRYDVLFYNNNGDGPKNPIYAFAGFDRPAQVTDAAVKVGDDFKTTTITWTAPTHGYSGGTYDPAKTRYDIVRLPDNVKVATDLDKCTFNDNIRRLMRYSYRIIAKNESGETAVETADFVAGNPIEEFPLEAEFTNPTALKLQWTALDNNNDSYTWLFGSDLGHAVFGDYEMAGEYIISPTSVIASMIKDADEWLIAPPAVFEAGTDYKVSLKMRTLTPEIVKVYYGPRISPEGMTEIAEFTAQRPVYNETNQMLFQTYECDIPEAVKGTTACIAVQIATPVVREGDNAYYSYLQLGGLTIDEGKAAGIEDVTATAPANTISFNGEILTINGEFANAALYNINGARVMTIDTANTLLSGLAAGLYILNVDGRSFKLTCK